MSISNIRFLNFRNISEASLEIPPAFTVFYGKNGAGKTSLLEAIYYLSSGKSFRNKHWQALVEHKQAGFTIVLNISKDAQLVPLGIERYLDGTKNLRLNGKNTTLSALSKELPVQFIGPDTYRYFSDGPKTRRQFLDWGVFHVEQSFINYWKEHQKLLRQRNSCLKCHSSSTEIQAWDSQLTHVATEIDILRARYTNKLAPIIKDLLAKMLGSYSFSLTYQRGWDPKKTLEEVLTENLYKDRQIGYTRHGPQRADLQLYINEQPVNEILSQGQLKLAAYAMKLAQGMLLKDSRDISPIFLIDDLPSELDAEKRIIVADILKSLQAQTLITCIDPKDLTDIIQHTETALFSVEQGTIKSKQLTDYVNL